MLTESDIIEINRRRRARGLPPLTLSQSRRLVSDAHETVRASDSDAMDFLIGYTTGIPMPSTGGIVGAMLHDEGATVHSDPSPSYHGGGGDFGGGGSSVSYGSDSSSSSSSDSSSSSSDSGGSSGGGSD